MIKLQCLFLVLSTIALIESRGVTRWCVHYDKYLDTYSNGTYRYSSFETAKSQCLQRSDCFGITRKGSVYTLRKDWELKGSPRGEVSYVPCAGYFSCSTFGLKSVHGKFLCARPNGFAKWDREEYRDWEQVTFEQHGKDSGFLKSYHGNYLAATPSHKLEWNREHKRSWELFKVYQYEDKIALQSSHGGYLSATYNGYARVNRFHNGSWEWFTVYPQSCLNNIQCDCSKTINKDDYEMSGVTYHRLQGLVKAYPPEQVGFQHIDNKDSSVEQSTTFTVSESVTETSSFSHTAGASVTVGTTFSTGIPVVAAGEISVDVSAYYDYSSGREKSETKTLRADYNCVAAPGTSVTCEALLFKYRVTVPYTQTWQHKRLPCGCTSEGVFTEITANEMRLNVDEE